MEKLTEFREQIPSAPARELRDIRDRLRVNIKQFAKTFGCVKEPSVFADEFILASLVTGVPNVAKALIDQEYFTNFCNGHPDWKKYSPHLRLQVHFTWTVSELLIFHYYLPEAVLFEDMALALNQAIETESAVKNLGFVKGGNLNTCGLWLVPPNFRSVGVLLRQGFWNGMPLTIATTMKRV